MEETFCKEWSGKTETNRWSSLCSRKCYLMASCPWVIVVAILEVSITTVVNSSLHWSSAYWIPVTKVAFPFPLVWLNLSLPQLLSHSTYQRICVQTNKVSSIFLRTFTLKTWKLFLFPFEKLVFLKSLLLVIQPRTVFLNDPWAVPLKCHYQGR